MSGIADVGLVELAAVLAGVQGGLRIAERIVDGIMAARRPAAQTPVAADWSDSLKQQTQAIHEVTALLHRFAEQEARSVEVQNSILQDLRRHDEAARRHWEHGGG